MKGLDAIRDIENIGYKRVPPRMMIEYVNTIKNELKAFEIMKERDIDRDDIKSCHTVESYNNRHIIILTPEEFDVLKKVFCNE